jgi:hypothetical protein
LSADNKEEKVAHEAINNILHAAEKAFELVTKRKCSAIVKTVAAANGTVYVSHTSDTTSYPTEAQTDDHFSEYSSIVNITRDDSRYYICNDVWMSFRNGQYSHPKLKDLVERGIVRQLVRLVSEYVSPPRNPIAFRSTLVVPIRYIHSGSTGTFLDSSPYKYVGFLCIDSKSRRSFKSRVISEIGALYADAICSIFLASENRGGS